MKIMLMIENNFVVWRRGVLRNDWLQVIHVLASSLCYILSSLLSLRREEY